MTSRDFIAGLAEIMGVEKTELATVDRALAKAGLREVARGRYRPDITLQEGLQLVLAWAGARNLTEAAEEVERLKCFHVSHGDHQLPAYARSGKDTPEFRTIYGRSEARLGGEGLFEVLAIAARALGADDYPADNYWVNVEKNGEVELLHREEPLRTRTLWFNYLGKLEWPTVVRITPPVKFSVSVSGTVLKWIYEVTEGAA